MFPFFKKHNIEIAAPITGKCIGVTQVPDDVFAQKMVGDGVAIEPTDGMVVAPCNGKIVQIFPTNHAIGIETTDGIDLLIHLGLDTVELKGEGFERLIEEGQEVKVGTPLLKMDINKVKAGGKNTITPVIITTMDNVIKLEIITGDVTAGENIIMKIKLN